MGCQGSWGCSEPFSRGFKRRSPLRKFLGSNEHLDWLKTDLNVAETSNVQDYKCTKIRSEWKYTGVKAKSQAGNIWVEYIMTPQQYQN